jgi:6-pyruvoyltetrahydropterin/6-carboxytetrahydropterin synthase
MWKISKSFEFNYGHRIATQELKKEFALDQQCKCRHLHGHTASIEVCLQSNKLKDGFVTDFYHLNWLKVWLNKNIDHKFILDRVDPMVHKMFGRMLTEHYGLLDDEWGVDTETFHKQIDERLIVNDDGMGYVFNYDEVIKYNKKENWGGDESRWNPKIEHDEEVQKEYYESFYFVDFPPTSECLSKWIYDFVAERMKPLKVEVASVTWYESPKSKSVYSGNNHKE